jgi:hypothetical protein
MFERMLERSSIRAGDGAEQYNVIYWIQNDEGFFEKRSLLVLGLDNKRQHNDARRIVEKKYPGCQVVQVVYQ